MIGCSIKKVINISKTLHLYSNLARHLFRCLAKDFVSACLFPQEMSQVTVFARTKAERRPEYQCAKAHSVLLQGN